MSEALFFPNGINADTGDYLAPATTQARLAHIARGEREDTDDDDDLEKRQAKKHRPSSACLRSLHGLRPPDPRRRTFEPATNLPPGGRCRNAER